MNKKQEAKKQEANKVIIENSRKWIFIDKIISKYQSLSKKRKSIINFLFI
jgi:hypothetical protein